MVSVFAWAMGETVMAMKVKRRSGEACSTVHAALDLTEKQDSPRAVFIGFSDNRLFC
jgi:hypothetical protein